jgi:two-component system heavy metal sensor histidine kinase CusS
VGLVRQPFDLSEFLTLLIEDGDPYPHNLKVSSALQSQVVWACDSALARQLIHNLFANAIKYNMPSGWIHVDLRLLDGRIVLTISNSSGEIPSDLSERAFDRFYRGNSAHSRKIDGQGLGLSLAMEIAKLHQGRCGPRMTQFG